MIAQRIDEYKDSPYQKTYEHTQEFVDKHNALLEKREQEKLQAKRDKINSKIKALNEQINDMYEDCYHRPDYIAEKVLKIRNQIKDLKNQL